MKFISIIPIWLVVIFGYKTMLTQNVEVWPGDANNNGIVNNIDVLYLGQLFGRQGPERNTISINWQAENATSWGIHSNNQDAALLDCSGNGQVDFVDTIAIRFNYGLTHGTASEDSFLIGNPAVDPQLNFHIQEDSLVAGNRVNMTISLGENGVVANEFYGIAFSIIYDTLLIQEGSFSANLINDWIGVLGMVNSPPILMFHENASDAIVDFAITRTDRTNVSGTGDILNVSFVIEDNLIGKQNVSSELDLQFTDAVLVDNSLHFSAVAVGSLTLNVVAGVSTLLQNL